MPDSPPTRRDLLRLSGTLAGAGIAGCLEGRFDGSGKTQSAESIPTSGDVPRKFADADQVVRDFMAEHDIPGGVLGIGSNGETRLERGYGYRDAERTKQVESETLFRIASLSKVFTRAAIQRLLHTGQLERSQSVFELLEYEPLSGETYNDKLDAVTVGQLLDHRGGWDRNEAYDPLFTQLDIAVERGWEEPPTERQLIRYMMSEPLQFEPGERTAYSNLGYLILGHVIETVTGQPYQQYLERELLEPHSIEDISLGRSLPEDRPDRETWYFDTRACRNVAEMEPLDLVRCPDGGFYQETTSASGGHIATVTSMLEFMSQYWLNGRPRSADRHQTWNFNGTLPGTFTLALQHEGVDIVVLFNQRGYDPNYHDIRTKLRDVVADPL